MLPNYNNIEKRRKKTKGKTIISRPFDHQVEKLPYVCIKATDDIKKLESCRLLQKEIESLKCFRLSLVRDITEDNIVLKHPNYIKLYRQIGVTISELIQEIDLLLVDKQDQYRYDYEIDMLIGSIKSYNNQMNIDEDQRIVVDGKRSDMLMYDEIKDKVNGINEGY